MPDDIVSNLKAKRNLQLTFHGHDAFSREESSSALHLLYIFQAIFSCVLLSDKEHFITFSSIPSFIGTNSIAHNIGINLQKCVCLDSFLIFNFEHKQQKNTISLE